MSTQTKTGREFSRQRLAPALLLTPSGIVIAAVTIVPIVVMIVVAFTDYNQRSLFSGKFNFVGVEQFTKTLSDVNFWLAFIRTIVFTAALVVGSVAIGVFLSHMMTRISGGLRIVVTIVLVFAWAMPNVAASLVWNWMFQPGYGVMNWLITQLHIFGDFTSTDWSAHPVLAFIAIWLLIVWQAVPFIALTVYAAETQIPPEYSEAAQLDGANDLHVYRLITWPFLRPTVMLVAILSTIWDFNVFNQIWLVSAGGPNGATSTLGVFTYATAFVSFDLGAGSAIAVLTTLLLVALTSVYVRSLVRSGEKL